MHPDRLVAAPVSASPGVPTDLRLFDWLPPVAAIKRPMSKMMPSPTLRLAPSIATLAMAPEAGSDRMNSANRKATSASGMRSTGRPRSSRT